MPEQSALLRDFPVRAIAACFALAAFSIAMWAGLSSGRDAEAVLVTAMVAMFVCQPIGFALGIAFKHASLEQITSYKEKNPIPLPYDAGSDSKPGDEFAESDKAAEESTDSRTIRG